MARALEGRRFTAIERRGKWLRLVLDGVRVFSHLAKWSSVILVPRITLDHSASTQVGPEAPSSLRDDPPPSPSATRASHDTRGREKSPLVRAQLGPDPLVDGIDVKALHEKLARRKLPIKPTLLDQTVLAGVGNIQATEALYSARIDPRRPARSLSRAEVSALARGLRRSIAKTLKLQEGPVITYVEEAGPDNPFTIYGKEGTPCPSCKRPLAKMILGGRGTVFCAHCQK